MPFQIIMKNPGSQLSCITIGAHGRNSYNLFAAYGNLQNFDLHFESDLKAYNFV